MDIRHDWIILTVPEADWAQDACLRLGDAPGLAQKIFAGSVEAAGSEPLPDAPSLDDFTAACNGEIIPLLSIASATLRLHAAILEHTNDESRSNVPVIRVGTDTEDRRILWQLALDGYNHAKGLLALPGIADLVVESRMDDLAFSASVSNTQTPEEAIATADWLRGTELQGFLGNAVLRDAQDKATLLPPIIAVLEKDLGITRGQKDG